MMYFLPSVLHLIFLFFISCQSTEVLQAATIETGISARLHTLCLSHMSSITPCSPHTSPSHTIISHAGWAGARLHVQLRCAGEWYHLQQILLQILLLGDTDITSRYCCFWHAILLFSTTEVGGHDLCHSLPDARSAAALQFLFSPRLPNF